MGDERSGRNGSTETAGEAAEPAAPPLRLARALMVLAVLVGIVAGLGGVLSVVVAVWGIAVVAVESRPCDPDEFCEGLGQAIGGLLVIVGVVGALMSWIVLAAARAGLRAARRRRGPLAPT